MRVGSMRKALKSRVEFEFLDAPFLAGDHLSAEQIAELGGSASGRTWIKWADMAPGKRPSQSTAYIDFDQTYLHMVDGLRAHAPDGVLGFSQGATAVALLLAQLKRRQDRGLDLDVPAPRFAVLVGGRWGHPCGVADRCAARTCRPCPYDVRARVRHTPPSPRPHRPSLQHRQAPFLPRPHRAPRPGLAPVNAPFPPFPLSGGRLPAPRPDVLGAFGG
jgi:hypothetical protein